ncbi:MAG TPA: FAD-dependent oxidoreductase, partial [Anaerolineae bacterium]|nr:FAD-dependent oxidoreductase [Anaerolineae bacterium]
PRHLPHGRPPPAARAGEIGYRWLQVVAEGGGWTRVRADVTDILIEKGVAVGVRLADGEEIRADQVVSAIGVANTIRHLLPESYRNEKWAQSVLDLRPSYAHVCLYIGFKGDIRKAGATAANKWFYHSWDMNQDVWRIDGEAEGWPPAPVLYCSFGSLKNPTHEPGPEQRHMGEVITFVPWEVFAPWQGTDWRKRGAAYDGLKEEMQGRLLQQFLEHMPGLRGMVDYVELSTPLSTDHFVRPQMGSIYGLEPTGERFQNEWLRPASPIPNLYFGGSEVSAVGVIGAMMGGVLAAAAARPWQVLPFLKRLM